MSETATEQTIQHGFICPNWAKNYWDPNECTVEPTTDGTAVVLDHGIQTTVFSAETVQECTQWLLEQPGLLPQLRDELSNEDEDEQFLSHCF